MDSPELVDVSCPECGCWPVEVLKKLRGGKGYLWCRVCRGIWAVDIWALDRPAPLGYGEQDPLARRPEREDAVEAGAREELAERAERPLVEPLAGIGQGRHGRGERPPDHALNLSSGA